MEAPLESLASQASLNVESPPAQFNFASHLFRINQSRANKLAYIDDAGATTYGQLEDRSRRFASALHSLSIRPEERLLLVMLDTVDLPIAFLGALYAGVVPVVVNTLLTSSDYAYMLTHSRARAVIASGAVLPTVAQGLTDAEYKVVSR